MVNPGLVYQYRIQRQSYPALEAFKNARRYLELHPAEFNRLEDGTFERFVWPGGYPLFYLSTAGNVLCAKCAAEDTSEPAHLADVNYEDPDLYCSDCGERIESAYAEPEES